MREYLQTFQEEFENVVVDASDSISSNQTDRKVYKNSLIWKTKVIDRVKDKLEEENTMVAFLDIWAISIRMLRFFESGDGADMFKADQQTAIDASKLALSMIEDVAVTFIPGDKLPLLRKNIYNYALNTPFTGTFKGSKKSTLRLDKNAIKTFGKILSVPLMPVKVVGKGKKDVDSFKSTASRYADIMEDMPQEMRWELELLMLAIDKNESINSGLGSFASLSKTAEELAITVDKLPTEMRVNVELFMDSVDQNKSTQSALESLNTISNQTKVISETMAALPETISQNIDESIKKSFDETQTLVDHITLRVALLLILLFILGALLSVLIILLRKKRK